MDFSQNYPSVIESTIYQAVQVHDKTAVMKCQFTQCPIIQYNWPILLCHVSEDDVIEVLVSRSQTLSSIAQHRRGKGLGAFPGDDVSFPLDLGEVINVNRRFDLLRERFGSVCAKAMILALESAANADRRSCQGAWVRAFKGRTVVRN